MGLGDFFSGLPVVGGFFDHSAEDGKDQLNQIANLYRGLHQPNLSWNNLSPELVNAHSVTEDPNVRSALLSNLSKMAYLGDHGLSEQDAGALETAKQSAAKMARNSTEDAMQNASRRGVAGGGMSFALGAQGAQDAAERERQAAFDTAAQTAKQRALYTQAYGQDMSNLRNQDFNVNKTNTDIINKYNELNTGRQNQFNVMNQQQQNQMLQDRYNNQLKQLEGQAGAMGGVAKADFAQNAANNSNRNANASLGFNIYDRLSGYSKNNGYTNKSPGVSSPSVGQNDEDWYGDLDTLY